MRVKQVTYEDYTEFSGESDLTVIEMLDLFDKMSWVDGAFACIPITDTSVFQFICESDGRFLLEFTNDSPDMVFHQKRVSKAECREMIIEIFEEDEIEPNMLEGFEATSIINTKVLSKSKKILYGILILIGAIGLFIVGAYFIMNGKL